MNTIKKFYPHLAVIIAFIAIALFYFSPVLQGKVIYQQDIEHYTGMAQEQIKYREATGNEAYWTNSAFGGMPTYQLGAKYPHNYVKAIDSAIRFLPRPADYLFLYFVGFYVLLISLGMKPLRSFIGALAFGFSTYLIIILGVGHNAKAHAIAYMPMVIAGVLLVFRKKYIVGGLLTLFATALEINANHYQMTYYLLFLLLVIGVYYTIDYIKNKDFKGLGIAMAIFAGAVILSIGTNATGLMATAEYTKFSTRSNSELTFKADGSAKTSSNAMTYDYITEYSYGLFESLNLVVPRLTGGANAEQLNSDSNLYRFFVGLGANPEQAKQSSESAPTYWGDQPIVAAPAYIGAVVFFLFVLGLFTEHRKIKYIFLTGTILSLFLSYGKHLPGLTDFFINYVPMYNKFRAVSSIQILLEMCVPALAILGLYSYSKAEEQEKMKALKLSGIITGGLLVILFFAKGMLSFSGANDGYFMQAYGQIGPGYVQALIEDRKAMYTADILRSFVLIALAAAVLFLLAKAKIKENLALVLIGVLMVGDLVLVDRKYVNNDAFVSAYRMTHPFEESPADAQILKDKSIYRVFEVEGGLNSARTSFFHHSLGGYHAAKPRRMQELVEHQMGTGNHMTVFNMMNVKYVVQNDEEGQPVPMANNMANGNAWFVSTIKKVNTADEEMKAMDSLDSKKVAVFNQKIFADVALKDSYVVDSLATIKLTSYDPNKLVYESNNTADGVAVFSEVYYPKGWIAKIDGKETPIFSVDYVLRGISLPKGKHTVEFSFEPEVIKKGSIISLISFVLMVLVTIGALYYGTKKCKEAKGNC